MPEYKKIGYLTSGFKMFHLKDQERREFSYHYHDFHKILILLDGDVTYCIEGRSYELMAGDIVLVNAGEVHRPILKSGRAYERIILYVSPSFLAEYPCGEHDLSLCLRKASEDQSHVLRLSPAHAPKLGDAIRALDSSRKDTDFASDLNHKLMFLAFMVQLNRAALHGRAEFIGNSPSDGKIVAIVNYLHAHLTEDISIDDLSARFYLSRYYLMHAFKKQTGYTINGYLAAKRLFLAKKLIAEGTPVIEACYACGFKNYSTFSRAYKKNFGETARESRPTRQ